MALSSAKRALIATVILLVLGAGAAGILFLRMHRPMQAADSGNPPDILKLLPPDAPVFLYIDAAALRGLQGSPLAAVLGLASRSPQQDRDYADFVRNTGFDYERDMDHAALALWPAGMATPENPLGDGHAFAIVDGRFDQRKIEAYALRTGRLEMRGTQSIYEVPGQPPVAFQFLSADRIAIASGQKGDTLLGASQPQARDGATEARIDRVAGAPFFAVARTDHLAESFYDNFRSAPQAGKFIRSIQALSLSGKPQRDGIVMALDAECDSMKNALEISTLLDGLRMLGSLAMSDPNTRRQMTPEQIAFSKAFLRKLQITHQDRWVRLTLAITPEMLAAASAAPSPLRALKSAR